MNLLARLERDGVSFALDADRMGFGYDGPEDVLSDDVLEELRAQGAEVLAALQARPAANTVHVDVALVDVPLTGEKVDLIPKGALYRDAESPASHARARESSTAALKQPAPIVHVSHVEREPRYGLQPMKDADRVCAACGAPGPKEGPVPWGWDHHAVRGRADLLGTCSPACRSKLSFKERRLT